MPNSAPITILMRIQVVSPLFLYPAQHKAAIAAQRTPVSNCPSGGNASDDWKICGNKASKRAITANQMDWRGDMMVAF
jgi:hypothetical protein